MSVGHLKNTVKPESNDHPWDPQKVVVAQKVVVGQRLVNNSVVVLAVFGIQGSHCSEVNKGVTVLLGRRLWPRSWNNCFLEADINATSTSLTDDDGDGERDDERDEDDDEVDRVEPPLPAEEHGRGDGVNPGEDFENEVWR